MSTKSIAQKNILALLKTLPEEKLKHYASFKDMQIKRFEERANEMSKEDLTLQYTALKNLCNDKYKNYYELDDKLLKPKGNPNYYDRIMAAVNGQNQETMLSTIRTVVFGK
ncbi:CBP6 Cytochrome B pre-mRNA-processing protein 6 [Candida maltosa Xu316]|uniref:Cytochrome B pre-mRNA-processing protein 6 n=1 Tax=Candida maltosa (strain Xu316) TaxID=1245528 RepID=M3J545_CANMX|nr:hypothetical protein G210_2575 [Candida maltosa Xu316]